MNLQKYIFTLLLITCFCKGRAQIDDFLTPADSLDISRRNAVVIAGSSAAVLAYAGLGAVWYSDYEKSSFHFVNDNAEWLQVDKIGHGFSTYQLSSFSTDLLRWSGVDKTSRAIYGTVAGFAAVTAVEVFDGFSAGWGASWGDIAANATGSALFLTQEMIWNEQRIIPKFSFHTTVYPSARPEVLGSGFGEQVFKDYNGQTYWLSANINAFAGDTFLPNWINFAVGYGAEGMITANDRLVNSVFFPEQKRVRQYYFSFDIDLTRINTTSSVLRTIFKAVNTLKMPLPTLELRENGVVKFHPIYF